MFSLFQIDKLDPVGQYKIDLFLFRHIHKKLGEILEAVFGGYIKDRHIFYEPNEELIEYFNLLRERILEIDLKPKFIELPITEFRQFRLKNYKEMIEWWSLLKNDFYQDDNMLKEKANFDYDLPSDLQLMFRIIDDLIIAHTEKKNAILKANHIYPAKEKTNFRPNSTRGKIFDILAQANEEFVRVLTISQKVNIKDHTRVRIVLNQLRKKLEEDKSNLKIETNRKGYYRLLVS